MILINKFIKKKFLFFKKEKYQYIEKDCEICESKDHQVFQNIGKVGLKPGSYGYLPISICKNCGHKFLSPRFSNIYYKKFYEEEYGKIPFKRIKPTELYKNLQKQRGENLFNYFSKKLKLKNNGKILDHGAATGLFLLPWKEKGWNCYGIEPHKASVKYAKTIGLNVKCGYGEKLPFKNNLFDVVISMGSFEHAYDLNKTFEEFHRTLKNNGKLILRWRSDKLLGSPLEYYNQITYRYFSKKTLINLFIKHNFKFIADIKKKLEGYDTFEYIVCKKITVKHKTNYKKINIKNFLTNNNSYAKKYFLICSKIKKLNKNINIEDKFNFIKKNKLGLMNIGRSKSVNRVFFEMKNYLIALKKFSVINERK